MSAPEIAEHEVADIEFESGEPIVPPGPPRPFSTRVVLAPIRVWMWTAPVRTPRCRFDPTCSTYAVQSIDRFGPLRGAWLAVSRVARCHPWNPGGDDPVPLVQDPRRSA